MTKKDKKSELRKKIIKNNINNEELHLLNRIVLSIPLPFKEKEEVFN